ncbi:MAG TPA: hypothetical protein DDW65_08925 [Firmicutes bacterium]|nr:hypothetical protein [Bacillota bacterium]
MKQESTFNRKKGHGFYFENKNYKDILTSRVFILFLINGLIFLFLSIFRPDAFLDWKNLKAVFSLMTYDMLLAAGMTLILILGGIDLSVGSVLALTSVIIALSIKSKLPVSLSLLLGLIVAISFGVLNGLLILKGKIAPFIATLGTMSIARGIAVMLTLGQFVTITDANKAFIDFGRFEIIVAKVGKNIISIPIILILTLVILIILGMLLKTWKPLNQAFFAGANIDAARLSGMRVFSINMAGYIISALFCYIAAVFMTANNRMGFANVGSGYEMKAIAAAVVGGASMLGGEGSLMGTFLGVLMLAFIANGFILMGGSSNWQQASIGIILILAVTIDAITNKGKRKE